MLLRLLSRLLLLERSPLLARSVLTKAPSAPLCEAIPSAALIIALLTRLAVSLLVLANSGLANGELKGCVWAALVKGLFEFALKFDAADCKERNALDTAFELSEESEESVESGEEDEPDEDEPEEALDELDALVLELFALDTTVSLAIAVLGAMHIGSHIATEITQIRIVLAILWARALIKAKASRVIVLMLLITSLNLNILIILKCAPTHNQPIRSKHHTR